MPAKNAETKKKPIRWEEAIEIFETHLRAKRSSECTLKEYVPTVRHLARELCATTSPCAVELHDLRDLQCRIMSGEASRSGRPPSASTVAGITKVWRTFFRFLLEDERIDRDPTARLERPRVPKRVPMDVLTVKEVERLLDAPSAFTPTGLRDRAILDLLFSTGLRRGELCALDLTDVDHEEREIRVVGKGEKGRVVPLTRSAYARLRDYLDRARPVLAAKCKAPTAALLVGRGRGRVTGDVLDYLLEKSRVAAGIKKRLTNHTMRRTFATTLDRNGVSVRYIQALLGHESLNTTAVYLRIDKADLRRELLLRHPRERMPS